METQVINLGDVLVASMGLVGTLIVALLARIDGKNKERIIELTNENQKLANEKQRLCSAYTRMTEETLDYHTMTEELTKALAGCDPKNEVLGP
jgi:hypothetical protein